jgi:hypothetical protein
METLGTVRSDGTLELDHKVSVPPGRVKVRVESVETLVTPRETLIEFVQRSRRELEAAGHQFRPRDEIDAELEGMRNEWTDSLEDQEHTGGRAGDKE